MFNELYAFPVAFDGRFNPWSIQATEERVSEETSTQSRVVRVTVQCLPFTGSHRSDGSTGGQFVDRGASGDPSFSLCSS